MVEEELPWTLQSIFRAANERKKNIYLEEITDPDSIRLIGHQEEYDIVEYKGREGLQLGPNIFIEILRKRAPKKIKVQTDPSQNTLNQVFKMVGAANLGVIAFKMEHPERVEVLKDRGDYQIVRYRDMVDGIRMKGIDNTLLVLRWPDEAGKGDDNPNIY